MITANTTVHAVYKDISEAHLIVFKNYDGTVLDSHYVLPNVLPAYKGAVPVKAATARYTYKFNAWTPTIVAATVGATYTAVFDSTGNRYLVVFLQAAGGYTLQKDSVAYGAVPVYSGTTPVKASSEDYDYVFDGWNPALANVTGDATYTACFNRESKGTTSALQRSPAVFSFSVEGEILRVENAALNTPYALMDVQGRVLARGLIQSSVQNIALPGTGNYLVKVGTDSRLVRVRQ